MQVRSLSYNCVLYRSIHVRDGTRAGFQAEAFCNLRMQWLNMCHSQKAYTADVLQIPYVTESQSILWDIGSASPLALNTALLYICRRKSDACSSFFHKTAKSGTSRMQMERLPMRWFPLPTRAYRGFLALLQWHTGNIRESRIPALSVSTPAGIRPRGGYPAQFHDWYPNLFGRSW